MENNALAVTESPVVWLTQAPEFGERLAALKSEWEARASAAESLEVSDENRTEARNLRAEIRKQFEAIEGQRKDALAPVRAKIDAFNAIYKECVTDAFSRADGALKAKIDAIESGMKSKCEERLRIYWAELCAANNIGNIPFDALGIRIGLTESRQKTPKKLMDALQARASEIRSDMDAISRMDGAEEIMAEYRQTYNFAQSVGIVTDRRRRIEAERQETARLAEAEARTAQAVTQVEASAPEVLPPPVAVAPAPTPAKEPDFPPVFEFTIYFSDAEQWETIKPLLISLRDALKENGIAYQ